MRFARQTLLLLLCLSFLASCTSTAAPESATSKSHKKDLIARLNDAVFCISIITKGKAGEKRFSVGTAFLVGDGLLASAAHVPEKTDDLLEKFDKSNSRVVAWKRYESGEVLELPIEIAVSDQSTDLAIYRFDFQNLQKNPLSARLKSLTLAENLPPLGAEVVSVGYYGAYDFPFNSLGSVAMIDKGEDIFSDLTLMPGNSGAPVCDLETGAVLGVTVSVLDLGNETVRFGIAKRALRLRELLQKMGS